MKSVNPGEGGFLPEVILLTLKEVDPFVRVRIGGLVVSRSVKYLGIRCIALSWRSSLGQWRCRDQLSSSRGISDRRASKSNFVVCATRSSVSRSFFCSQIPLGQ